MKDADTIGAPTLGCVSFPAAALAAGQRIDGWHPIIDSSGKALKHGRSALRVSLAYTCACPAALTSVRAQEDGAGWAFLERLVVVIAMLTKDTCS